MRFVDRFAFRDNDFDPAEHPKSKENGQFVKKGTGEGSAAETSKSEKPEKKSHVRKHPEIFTSEAYRDHVGKYGLSRVPEGIASDKEAKSSAEFKINSDYRKAIKSYSNDTSKTALYNRLNSALFSGGELDHDAKQVDDVLSKMFEEEGIRNPIRVYKGIAEEHALRMKEGGTFSFKGYLSTSSDLSVGYEFANDYAKNAALNGKKVGVHMLCIDAPKGAKAREISKYSKYPEESEILFKKGATGRINRVYFDDRTGYNIYMISLDEF